MYHIDDEGDGVYVNLYNSSVFERDGLSITQETDYPRDGKIRVGIVADRAVKVYLRIPDWCGGMKVTFDTPDGRTEYFTKASGPYCELVVNEPGELSLTIELEMPVVELHANPKVRNCAGRIAVKRGPVVYCAEGIDNGGSLKSVKVIEKPDYICERSQIEGNGIIKISCNCEMIIGESNALYSESPFVYEKKRLTLIAYAAWANRGRTEMMVWLMK